MPQSKKPTESQRFPFVVKRRNRTGRVYYYFRYEREKYVRLYSDYGSPAFLREYAGLVERYKSKAAPSKAYAENSLGWLITEFKTSPAFTKLAPKTRAAYDTELRRLAPILDASVYDIRRKHLRKIQNTLADKPRMHEYFGQVCKRLYNWGIKELELDLNNPAAGIGREFAKTSYRAWTPEERATMDASKAIAKPWLWTAYLIARYTGARVEQAVRMSDADRLPDGVIRVPPLKNGNPALVPEHPELTAHLDTLPPGRFVPHLQTTVSSEFGAHRRKIGLSDDLVLHGLRHTLGKELAEAGASGKQVQASLGHRTTAMAEHYQKQADLQVLGRDAHKRLHKPRTSD